LAEIVANSIKEAGEDLKLLCPLAGSYYNDDIKDYTIATNWSKTHLTREEMEVLRDYIDSVPVNEDGDSTH